MTACVLCGEQQFMGLTVCPDCGVTAAAVSDTLVFVKPDPVHADRIRIGRRLEQLLTGRMHAPERGRVAAGHQALIRVPAPQAPRVLGYLADEGIPAVARSARTAWVGLPAAFVVLVGLTFAVGVAAGTALSLFWWTTPVFVALLLTGGQLVLRTPAIRVTKTPRLSAPAEHAAVRTLSALPDGEARTLLAQLVRAAQSARRDGAGIEPEMVDQLVSLASAVATDLADLELGVANDTPSSERLVAIHDALADRLRRATHLLYQLRAEAAAGGTINDSLEQLLLGLEDDVAAYVEARREMEGLFAEQPGER